MNEKMVIKTAKTLNREKFILEKLNKQIETLKEKENQLKGEFNSVSDNLLQSKQKEEEIKEINQKVRVVAEEEILKNKRDHNELQMLRELKKNVQKELSRSQQDNLNIKYALDSLKENRKVAENNLKSLQHTYSQVSMERDMLNNELLQYKQECDELLQLYELKKNEDEQLKNYLLEYDASYGAEKQKSELEQKIAKRMLDSKTYKVKLENGNVYEVKTFKTTTSVKRGKV